MLACFRKLFSAPAAVTTTVAGVVIAMWLVTIGAHEARTLLAQHWPVSLTMVFGSFVAGASSEGGGAVAFPVFTKVLHVAPPDAKLFALMIQSVGMTAAAITILALRVRIDFRAILLASVGGSLGVAASLLWLAPIAPAAETRVLFTGLQAGFAFVLIRSLRNAGGRAAAARMGGWSDHAILVLAGTVGGLLSGLVGSGLDLVTFAVLTLLFGVSEKVATPTSVVLMAGNSLVGVAVHCSTVGPPPAKVTAMWLAAVPVVVIGAPLGAWVCSWLKRSTIGWSLVGLIAIEVATTLVLAPWTVSTVLVGVGVSFGCVGVCYLMAQSQPTGVVRHRQQRVAIGDTIPASQTPLSQP